MSHPKRNHQLPPLLHSPRPSNLHTSPLLKESRDIEKSLELKLNNRPSVKPDTFSENPSAQKWFESYLWVGETVMDQSVAFFGSSSYFERKR